MDRYWYLDGDTSIIKYAGMHASFGDCDDFLVANSIHAVWIFIGKPEIEGE